MLILVLVLVLVLYLFFPLKSFKCVLISMAFLRERTAAQHKEKIIDRKIKFG